MGSETFRYQDVACCPEHGSIYFARILESRSGNKISDNENSTSNDIENLINLILSEDNDDEEYDDYDEDEDDEEE